MDTLDNLRERVLDISKRHGLAHIGSNMSVLPILVALYQTKGAQDIVIMDNAHAHLAHLVVREAYEGLPDIEGKLTRYGIHCDRQAGCSASGGSLGHGIGIGIGYALAFTGRKVHVIVSDGSMHEGSNWEALRIKHDLMLPNLTIHANFNGYTAVRQINTEKLAWQMQQFDRTIVLYHTTNGKGFDGVAGHYKKL